MSAGAECYLLTVSRAARVADPADLVGPLEQFVRALQQEGPLCTLHGRSPTHEMLPVLKGNKSLISNFLMTSDIEWNFGRRPEDPTHQVIFLNDSEGARGVFLKLEFAVEKPEDGIETSGPGLVAELVLGRDAAGTDEGDRTARLDRLLNLLAEVFAADERRIEARDAEEE
jgi:hypothetical protein